MHEQSFPAHGPRPLRGFVAGLLLFLLVGSLLAYAGRDAIFTPTVEAGDFAANSVLVQDAKSLDLWVGNYSRVGFHHPGPAILYVLAAGEVLFHDALGLVPSPFSGQLAAVALYSAFWIVLLAALFHRLLPHRRLGVLATSMFVAAAVLADHHFLTGIWFPHLYFLPFSVALLALVRLAGGKADALGSLAVAGGFLVNGHVAFAAILAVMLACVLAYNSLVHPRDSGRRVFSSRFLHTHARAMAWAAIAFAAFLVPLLVMTLKSFPGPLADYVRFGRGRSANDLASALAFTSVYWGGAVSLAVGMLSCAVLLPARVQAAFGWPPLRDTIAVILAATLALVLYAVFGVDLLKETYIGLFYYAVPALLVVVLAVLAMQRAEEWLAAAPRWPVIALLAGLCGLVVAGWPALREPVAGALALVAAATYGEIAGVDVLQQLDPGAFHRLAAVLVTVAAAAWLVEQKRDGLARAPYVLLVGILAVIAYRAAATPPSYAAMYRQQGTSELVSALESHAGDGRAVLMLDQSKDSSEVWAALLAAQAVTRRGGKEVFCVARGWHISFTRAARCSPSELQARTRFAVVKFDPGQAAEDAFAAGGLSFRVDKVGDAWRAAP